MHTRSTYHSSFFFFNDTATTEIYTLSLHDALPISRARRDPRGGKSRCRDVAASPLPPRPGTHRGSGTDAHARRRSRRDRKSTRLNSSHLVISYAVFCLKKKNTPI